jgi:hypothetical protein
MGVEAGNVRESKIRPGSLHRMDEISPTAKGFAMSHQFKKASRMKLCFCDEQTQA